MNALNLTHIPCPHCLAVNRVPRHRLREDPLCGRCGTALLTGRPVELTDSNFAAVTRNSDLPVVVDFWAPWCGPCRMMGPQYEIAARDLKGQALLVKVNSDSNPQTAQLFGVRSIPTLIKLRNGQEVARLAGATTADRIVAWICS